MEAAMKRIALIGLVVAAILAIHYAAGDSAQNYTGSAAMDRTSVQSSLHIVRMTSPDPANAQFRDLAILRNRTAVCGEISTRNTFGLLSFKRFIVTATEMHVEGQGDFSSTAWSRVCRTKGDPMTFIDDRIDRLK
jgi:uncharacterized transporter YbjL